MRGQWVCRAPGCISQPFKTEKALNLHRKSCRGVRKSVQKSGSRLKSNRIAIENSRRARNEATTAFVAEHKFLTHEVRAYMLLFYPEILMFGFLSDQRSLPSTGGACLWLFNRERPSGG